MILDGHVWASVGNAWRQSGHKWLFAIHPARHLSWNLCLQGITLWSSSAKYHRYAIRRYGYGYGDTAIFKKQGNADTASIYIFKNINCQIIFENEIDNKYYIFKGPTHIANVQVQPEIAKWLVQPRWPYVDGLPMLFQMRCYWPKSIGWSIGKYRTEYRELNFLFLNHNFSILLDTHIGVYRRIGGS